MKKIKIDMELLIFSDTDAEKEKEILASCLKEMMKARALTGMIKIYDEDKEQKTAAAKTAVEAQEKASFENRRKKHYWQNVCRIQEEQQRKGLKKYGLPLEQDEAMHINKRLQHLTEELIDGLMYIEHIKELIQQEGEN